MASLAEQTISMIEMLPDEELAVFHSLLKMLVRSWDPEFTKSTAEERRRMDISDEEIDAGLFYSEEDVWN